MDHQTQVEQAKRLPHIFGKHAPSLAHFHSQVTAALAAGAGQDAPA